MPTFKIYKTSNYTVMSNYHLQDINLSLKSKGLLSQMLSLPPDWDYSIKGLTAINKEGIDAIETALKELEKNNYLIRRKVRDKRGRIIDTEYCIYELPHTKNDDTKDDDKPDALANRQETKDKQTSGVCPRVENPHMAENPPEVENPHTVNPQMAEPEVENPHTVNPQMAEPEVENPHTVKPQMAEPEVENPHTVKPHTDNPPTDNPPQLNTKELNTKELNTKKLNIKSINQSNTPETHQASTENQDDGLMDRLNYEKLVKDNVDYESLSAKYDKDIQRLNEVIDIVVDTVTYNTQPIRISNSEHPAKIVKSVFLKLNSQHIDSVMKIIGSNTSSIKNPKNYIISCLYNSYLVSSNSNAMSASIDSNNRNETSSTTEEQGKYYRPKTGNAFTDYPQTVYTDEEIEEILRRKAAN